MYTYIIYTYVHIQVGLNPRKAPLPQRLVGLLGGRAGAQNPGLAGFRSWTYMDIYVYIYVYGYVYMDIHAYIYIHVYMDI